MKLKLITIFLILLVLTGAAGYVIVTYPYSSGARTGRLVKLSKKGIILPTYEGILDLGSGDKLTWEFSIHDKKLGEELTKLSGQKVRLDYDELFFKLIFDTKYNVVKYAVVQEAQAFVEDKRFCRLVNVMRHSQNVVEEIRNKINEIDPELLIEVRSCQN